MRDHQQELIKEYNDILAKGIKLIENSKDYNATMEELKLLPVVLSSKLRLWNVLKESAESNGYVFDKDKKEFVKNDSL